jgi:hypothetical protein
MNKFLFRVKILFIPCEENSYKPRFLESEHLFHYVLALLALKLIALLFIVYLPKTILFADLTKTALISLTNQERKAIGISALTENPTLNQAAYEKAKDMLASDYFSHWSPSGTSPWYWFKKAGYSYKLAGENLAIGFFDSEEVVNAWMNSPSHRDNLLNSNFREIGIRVNFQGSDTTVVVQLFGSPLKTTTKTTTVATPTPKSTISPSPEITPSPSPSPLEESPAPGIAGEEEGGTAAGVLGSEFQLTAPQTEIEKPSFKFSFLKFMMVDYPEILQRIIFYSLLLVLLAFILNIFIKTHIQDKRLLCRATTIIALLILFFLTNKELIIQIIPHNLLI